MKRLISSIFVLILIVCLLGVNAYAYTGGPLDDTGTETNGSGEIIFGAATPTPTIVTNYDALEITKDPGGESKKSGDSCVFAAAANGADYVRWYAISPDGKTYLASEIPTLFKGAEVNTESVNGFDRLILSNIQAGMSGYRFYASYTSGDLTMNTTGATLTVEAVATPSPTPAPTPTPTPTPIPQANNNNVTGGGVQGGGNTYNGTVGTGSMMGTNTNNYNQNTSIGAAGSASEPSAGGNYIQNTTKVENSRGKSHAGAYILAAVAGLVIVGSVLVMALYMKGKISLGKFEKMLGGNHDDSDMFDDGDYYNPDDYDDPKNT